MVKNRVPKNWSNTGQTVVKYWSNVTGPTCSAAYAAMAASSARSTPGSVRTSFRTYTGQTIKKMVRMVKYWSGTSQMLVICSTPGNVRAGFRICQLFSLSLGLRSARVLHLPAIPPPPFSLSLSLPPPL